MESESERGQELNLKRLQDKLQKAVEEREMEEERVSKGIYGRLSLTRKILEAKH